MSDGRLRPDRAADADRQPAPPAGRSAARRVWRDRRRGRWRSACSRSSSTRSSSRGAGALSLDFLIKGAPNGIGPAIVGTAEIVAIATLIAMPIGVLVALYLTEFAGGRRAAAIRLALDLLNGLPSIIIGLFVFGLLVVGQRSRLSRRRSRWRSSCCR